MSKRMKLEVNSEIKEILFKNAIPVQDGVSYLVNLYYELEPSYIPDELKRKILAINIVSKDYSSGLMVWKVNLFEETETGFEWISEWMDLFKKVNPDRRGVKSDVLKRMKKFFINNPSIRKDDIFAATEYYLGSLGDPKYCKKSHKFIYEIDGTSLLLDHLSKVEENKEFTEKYNKNVI